MTESIKKNTWVELHAIVLQPGERAPQVPEDTRKVPLEMRVKGFLLNDSAAGEEATIRTPSGRVLSGTLAAVNPPYTHQFGAPIPELLSIGDEVRGILRARGRMK